MRNTILSVIFFIILNKNVESANILYLNSLPSPSHDLWNKVIVDKLYSHGHNVTILSLRKEESVPGKTFILLENVYEKMGEDYGEFDFTVKQNPFQNIMFAFAYYGITSNRVMGTQGVQQLLKYPKTFKFDVIIYDFTSTQALLGFVEYFGYPPLISVSPFNIPSWTTVVADAPLYTAYMPHMTSGFGTQMSFVERIQNTLFWTYELLYRKFIHMRKENERARNIFGQNLTTLEEIERKTDLFLVNGDFCMEYYQPLPPNVIPVGGLQVKRVEPLPKVVKEFIARSNKGVILLSFGTNVPSGVLGDDKNKLILQVFASMPEYSFIWKYPNHSFNEIPPNILILDWVQQNSVLADPRTKLFITHGGLLSVQESTWYGVPMIGVPFFIDQYQNVDKFVRAGVGEKLEINEINLEDFSELLKKVLQDSSYQKKIKKRSNVFRNQPQQPLDRAMFWIEKTIENKGLSYLRSPSLEMKFYKVYMLDAAAVLMLIILGYVLVVRRHFGKQNGDYGKVKKE